jgi:signal transduction histidine kinase
VRNLVEKILADVRCPADTGPEGALAAAERTRLARELHDSFPQEFQAIILQLRLALLGASDPEVRLHVLNALHAAEAGLHKTREHIVSLREPGRRPAHPTPPHWPAWDELVAGAARVALTEYGLALEVALSAPDVRVAPELGTEVAAIVTEAVRNAAKHGGVPVVGCHTYLPYLFYGRPGRCRDL